MIHWNWKIYSRYPYLQELLDRDVQGGTWDSSHACLAPFLTAHCRMIGEHFGLIELDRDEEEDVLELVVLQWPVVVMTAW